MRTLILIALIFALGCGDSEEVEDFDAAVPIEDAEIIDDGDDEGDEDPSLPGDDGDDDEEEAPVPSKPWRYYQDGDECDLVSQNCPNPQWQTCIRQLDGHEWSRAVCVFDWGSRHEGHTTGWCTHYRDGDQRTDCAQGMVCIQQRCHVPCDPDGSACRTGAGGSEQSCVSTGDYPQPYCSSFPH